MKIILNIATEDGELLEQIEVEFKVEPDGYVQFSPAYSAYLAGEIRSAAQIVARRATS